MRAFFGLGRSEAAAPSEEEKASRLLQAAQDALNRLRLQTSQEEAFPLLNAATRSIIELDASLSRLPSDLQVVWRR